MKKLLLVFLVLAAMVGTSEAFLRATCNTSVYRSSYTRTDDDTQEIENALHFRGVVVASASANADSYIEIYDAEDTATSIIGRISLNTLGTYTYDIWLSSGLTYKTSGNSGGVTIIWRKK